MTSSQLTTTKPTSYSHYFSLKVGVKTRFCYRFLRNRVPSSGKNRTRAKIFFYSYIRKICSCVEFHGRTSHQILRSQPSCRPTPRRHKWLSIVNVAIFWLINPLLLLPVSFHQRRKMLSTICRSAVQRGCSLKHPSVPNMLIRPMAGTAESRTSAVSVAVFFIRMDRTNLVNKQYP